MKVTHAQPFVSWYISMNERVVCDIEQISAMLRVKCQFMLDIIQVAWNSLEFRNFLLTVAGVGILLHFRWCTCFHVLTFKIIFVAYLFYSEGQFLTKWFIGLVFIKAENVNIDLTYDIQSFTDTGTLFCWIVTVIIIRIMHLPKFGIPLILCFLLKFIDRVLILVCGKKGWK